MSRHPRIGLAHLDALATSGAEDPVLFLDPDTLDLEADAAAHAPYRSVVLRRTELADILGCPTEETAQQWAVLEEGYSRRNVLEQVEDEANADIERIMTEIA